MTPACLATVIEPESVGTPQPGSEDPDDLTAPRVCSVSGKHRVTGQFAVGAFLRYSLPGTAAARLLQLWLNISGRAGQGSAGNSAVRGLYEGQVLQCGVSEGCLGAGRAQHAVREMRRHMLR